MYKLEMAKLFLLMLLVTGLITFSQVLLKKILLLCRLGYFTFECVTIILSSYLTYLFLFCMAIAFILWSRALLSYDFSVAYPLVSLSYAWALVAGYFFFEEPLSIHGLSGVFLIIVGSLLVAMK